MTKTLVVVESPAKAKTIEKYLGADYLVRASYGHVRDLPKSRLGVDPEHDFSVEYEVPEKSKEHVASLKKTMKSAEGLVLAQKAGLDLNTVMEVVKVADFCSPLLVSNGRNILKRDFSPSFALKLMLKDVGLIEKFAKSLHSPTPALRVAEKNIETAVALGFGQENASALIKALEKETGVEVNGR